MIHGITLFTIVVVFLTLGQVSWAADPAPASQPVVPPPNVRINLPEGKDVLDRYEARTFSDASGNTLLYRFFKPDNYDANRRYPLVLFFHGAGGRGNDNKTQITDAGQTAAGWASEAVQAQHPCFIIAPQCPTDQRWVEVNWSDRAATQPAQPSEGLRMSMELLDQLQRQYNVDPDRIYVTGLSMGGFATWDLIARYPLRFAAAVPVCGGGDESTAARFKDLPVWAFHGSADNVVSPTRSRNMIAALRLAGGNPRYTEYEGVDHFSWVPAYNDPQLIQWLFAQKRAR